MVSKFLGFQENSSTTIPKTTKMTPVTLFRVFGVALFAKTAAILAQIRVNTIQSTYTVTSGSPPMAKWDTALASTSEDKAIPTAI